MSMILEMCLDPLLQLHEEVRITYVVDGYIAEMWTHDGLRRVASCRGQNIMTALKNLAQNLTRFKTLDDLREAAHIQVTT